MDPIDRQAAIDGFYEMASDMDYLCTVSDYVSFLESLPSAQPEPLERCPIYGGVCGYPSDQCYECPRHHGAQPEPQWIPCSERLPEEGIVLVTYRDRDIDILRYPTVYRQYDIIAWMPIEPWRGEEHEHNN